MEEARKYLRVFGFCTAMIFSLTIIIAGALTVRERTRKMIYGTDYAVLSFRTDCGFSQPQQNELVVDLSFLKRITARLP